MTDHERYLFDLQGYLKVDGVLDATTLTALNDQLDLRLQDSPVEGSSRRFGGLLKWGVAYLGLVDHPTLIPYLEALLGADYRLDHDYLDVIEGGLGPIGATLHGGGTPFDPSQYYTVRDGQMHNGLTVVAFYLHDVNPGDGGFACIPGSHKANFRFPNEWRSLEHLSDPTPPLPFPDAWREIVRAVPGPAGTAVLFTEALTHGTLPWNGRRQRRTAFLKYSPHPLSWSPRYYQADDYEGLTSRQRHLLGPPNVPSRRGHSYAPRDPKRP